VVVVTWPDYDAGDGGPGAALTAAGFRVRLEPKLGLRSVTEMRRLLVGASGAIVSTDPFDATVFAAAPELRVIARVGVGVDSIDLDAATRHGVAVTVTPGANEATVADHAVAMMLTALRRIREHDASVRSGEWNRTGESTPWTLSGRTVGIVGYGRIGRLVAARLRGFDVEVLINDFHPVEVTAGVVGLEELLERAEVVSLHVPLTPRTHNLLGERELALMREDAILVNTARGVVDEAALERALSSRRIRGAALDVFRREPPPPSGLLQLPNVVLSPHIAGLSVESIATMTALATASVVDVLSGRMARLRLANPQVMRAPPFDRLPGALGEPASPG
jgi:D-3-phosphoglycerate dehydrogenase